MSNKERENIVSLITTVIVTVPYIIYIFTRFKSENLNAQDEFVFWASAILLLIPVRIVIEIIMYIVFSIIEAIITGKTEEGISDERDHMIELLSARNTAFVFFIGFIASLFAAVISKSPATMFSILIITGFLAEIFGIISKFYFNRKGI